MMKRRKWLISLVVLGVIMGFSVPKPKAGINGDVSLDSLAVRDTVAYSACPENTDRDRWDRD